jgi:leucyl-tRNA synthetase
MNTAVAKLITLNNHLTGLNPVPREAAEALVAMFAPSAPHIAEELWTDQLGQPYSVHQQSWPSWDEALVAEEELTVAVTVNGKPRGTVKVPVALRDDEGKVKELALDLPRVKALVDGQTVRKVIYVPGRILNLVVS